ncbi:hypothetical protein H6786_04625 [Candidatus Nomurabacteria bacterium]|nr:hypothetical protein [Candidatus Nomurabacteria bacterium]
METIEDLFLRYGEGTFSETFFDLDEVYGWSATIPVDPELRAQTEPFMLNAHAIAWRFRYNSDVLAPLTNEVTLVFSIREQKNKLIILVHTMYPGADVGELDGDVTDRENVHFFDWDHPGEMLPE